MALLHIDPHYYRSDMMWRTGLISFTLPNRTQLGLLRGSAENKIIHLSESLCASHLISLRRSLPMSFTSKNPPLLDAKFSICCLNYCLQSHSDGNQPVFSRSLIKVQAPSPSHSLFTDGGHLLLQETLPLRGLVRRRRKKTLSQ